MCVYIFISIYTSFHSYLYSYLSTLQASMSGQVQVFSSIVQYVAMQRETNNNHLRKTPQSAVRCLFGVPDHRETKLLIEEELRKQRDSFFRKWDFNIENFRSVNETKTNENSRKRSLENDENDIENPAKRLSFGEEKPASINGDENVVTVPRRVLQPRNDTQRQITDFWTSKKSTCEERLTSKPQKYGSQQTNKI